MSIKFEPDKIAKRIAPKSKIKKLLSRDAEIKRQAFKFLDAFEVIDKKSILDTALKTSKAYKKRIEKNETELEIIKKDPKQLIQRVQNAVIFEVQKSIGVKYKGERFRWLPSDANDPRPEHQLRYGKIYTIGEIDLPGEEFGCRCGMEILVNETDLEL